jgi:hypothetical protein
MWSLPQPHARAFPIFIDEDHAGRFEGAALRRPVASSPRAAPVIARSCASESPGLFFEANGFRTPDATKRPARMYGGPFCFLGGDARSLP